MVEDFWFRIWFIRPVNTLAGGCNLNRSPFQLIAKAGFDIRDTWQEGFPPASWLLGSHYAGIAIRQPD